MDKPDDDSLCYWRQDAEKGSLEYDFGYRHKCLMCDGYDKKCIAYLKGSRLSERIDVEGQGVML